MKIIKIKICDKDTTVWYKEKIFKNRREAIESAIHHLQRILDSGVIDAETKN